MDLFIAESFIWINPNPLNTIFNDEYTLIYSTKMNGKLTEYDGYNALLEFRRNPSYIQRTEYQMNELSESIRLFIPQNVI